MATIQQVLNDAQKETLKPVYVLAGSEQFLIKRAVAAVRGAATKDDATGLNADVFAGKGLKAATVTNTAHTLPMMAERRFVWVQSAESMAADEQAMLAEYLETPNETTCLVLTAEKLDGRGKLAKTAKRAHCLVEAKPLRGREIREFVTAEVKRREHTIAPQATDALLNAVGEDLWSLDDAIERLSLFVGPGQRIDVAAVEACVTHVRVETIWSLVDAIGVRDTKTALGAAESLLADREPPLRVLAMVARQLRIVARMREALAHGQAPEDAARAAGAPPFKARQLVQSARAFDMTQLGQAFSVLSEADVALKSSKRPPDVVLQDALLRLCA